MLSVKVKRLRKEKSAMNPNRETSKGIVSKMTQTFAKSRQF